MKSNMKNKQKQENLISYNKVLFLVTYKCEILGLSDTNRHMLVMEMK